MEVYLHIGTNKTGSSAIQSALINNVQKLLDYGYYLPQSKWDSKMRNGQISPGNGYEFAVKLAEGSNRKIDAYIHSEFEKAKLKGLNKIIFSNEVLVRLFSDVQLLKQLETVFVNNGVEKVVVFCVWRNAEDHALSLFKHRAKYGKFKSYSGWLKEDYETLRLAKSFIENTMIVDWNWNHHLYRENLVEYFFNGFLGVSNIVLEPRRIVNRSLTLNEIEIIRFSEEVISGFSTELYKSMIKSNVVFEENKHLDSIFRKEFREYAMGFKSTLELIAKLLPEEDSYHFLKQKEIPNSFKEKRFIVNEHQERLLLEFSNKFIQAKYSKKAEAYIKSLYIKLTKKLRKNVFDKTRFGGNL